MNSKSKPSHEGFFMPAEWQKHSGTELHWPLNRETWPGECLLKVERVYLNIIAVLSEYEPVHLLVDSELTQSYVENLMSGKKINSQNLLFHLKKTNDVWARDCGPIFIGKKETEWEYAITNWGYNAWGGKYPPYDDDNDVPDYFAEKYGIRKYDTGMILEGGSIETNGNGVLLTTESVLLNPNRNPELKKNQIEQNLREYLGQKKVIWLKNGLAGDDTDGHIDDLCRFVNERTIITMITDDPSDINYQTLQENLELLKAATDTNGRPFTIETLPMPVTRIEGTTVDGSEFVPASYANFYIANDVVLLPFYDERYDEPARELLQHYFPDRAVIGIPCRDLVWGQGSIHCITQQLYGM